MATKFDELHMLAEAALDSLDVKRDVKRIVLSEEPDSKFELDSLSASSIPEDSEYQVSSDEDKDEDEGDEEYFLPQIKRKKTRVDQYETLDRIIQHLGWADSSVSSIQVSGRTVQPLRKVNGRELRKGNVVETTFWLLLLESMPVDREKINSVIIAALAKTKGRAYKNGRICKALLHLVADTINDDTAYNHEGGPKIRYKSLGQGKRDRYVDRATVFDAVTGYADFLKSQDRWYSVTPIVTTDGISKKDVADENMARIQQEMMEFIKKNRFVRGAYLETEKVDEEKFWLLIAERLGIDVTPIISVVNSRGKKKNHRSQLKLAVVKEIIKQRPDLASKFAFGKILYFPVAMNYVKEYFGGDSIKEIEGEVFTVTTTVPLTPFLSGLPFSFFVDPEKDRIRAARKQRPRFIEKVDGGDVAKRARM